MWVNQALLTDIAMCINYYRLFTLGFFCAHPHGIGGHSYLKAGHSVQFTRPVRCGVPPVGIQARRLLLQLA
jgi:hypothetical protein